MIRSFLIALQFLTRVPIRLDAAREDGDLGRSALFYPLVGLLLGLLLAASAWLLAGVPVLLRGALLVVIWVVITGGLHLDGLADSGDAWVGGPGDAGRTLVIMKDPDCGPMGVTAVVLTLLVKFSALVALCEAGDIWAIVLAPVLGRTVLVLLFLTTPYVRAAGLGTVLAGQMPRRPAAWIVALIVLAVLILCGARGFLLLLISAFVFFLLRAAMRRRIGGATGDTAGAMVELTEAVVLLTAVVIGLGV